MKCEDCGEEISQFVYYRIRTELDGTCFHETICAKCVINSKKGGIIMTPYIYSKKFRKNSVESLTKGG